MTRTTLLAAAVLACAAALGPTLAGDAAARSRPVRVVVWDEQQPAQKQAYDNFLGNQIADHLRQRGAAEFTVRSVRLDDPDQGLPKEVLDDCDVLIWWGHARHDQVRPELAKEIVRRVKAGQLSLIALHSAHWSRPFVEAMNERATQDALKTLTESERKKAQIKTIPAERRLARRDEPLTPSSTRSPQPDGTVVLEIRLPMCVFPVVRNEGKPSHVRTLLKNHPIARGVPETFEIPQTEVYGGPFHVPTPDALIFEERWDSGESFSSGCLWNVGQGKVFYFRPGHETYPIFKQAEPLRIIENAATWLGSRRPG
jgi:trehalose utilization protein